MNLPPTLPNLSPVLMCLILVKCITVPTPPSHPTQAPRSPSSHPLLHTPISNQSIMKENGPLVHHSENVCRGTMVTKAIFIPAFTELSVLSTTLKFIFSPCLCQVSLALTGTPRGLPALGSLPPPSVSTWQSELSYTQLTILVPFLQRP